jgi:hypothetical protein
VLLALPLALALVAPASAGTDVRFLPTYFTGDFGSGISTDIAYLPFILVATSNRQEFRLTVPFIAIHSAEPITFTSGQVVGRGSGKSFSAGPTTESGLGDVILQEECFFVEGSARRPWISGIAWVKIPTADETRGLGTGKTDYGPGAAITQPIGPRVYLMGDARYIVRGTPAGSTVDYRNTLWLSAGVQWRLSKATSVNLFYDDRQSVVPGREDLRDVSFGLDRRLAGGAVFRGAFFAGLSSTAEDYGLSAGVSFGSAR